MGSILTGGVLSLGSLVGFVTVLGIAARNGIMLVSHYRHLEEEEGMPFGQELVVRGSEERLAPILMTALATGLALVPAGRRGEQAGARDRAPAGRGDPGRAGHVDAAEPVPAAAALCGVRAAERIGGAGRVGAERGGLIRRTPRQARESLPVGRGGSAHHCRPHGRWAEPTLRRAMRTRRRCVWSATIGPIRAGLARGRWAAISGERLWAAGNGADDITVGQACLGASVGTGGSGWGLSEGCVVAASGRDGGPAGSDRGPSESGRGSERPASPCAGRVSRRDPAPTCRAVPTLRR